VGETALTEEGGEMESVFGQDTSAPGREEKDVRQSAMVISA
jgi:hypothetical protein